MQMQFAKKIAEERMWRKARRGRVVVLSGMVLLADNLKVRIGGVVIIWFPN